MEPGLVYGIIGTVISLLGSRKILKLGIVLGMTLFVSGV